MAMRRASNNKLPISFALVLVLLLLNAMLSYRNRQRIIGSNARVTQSNQVLAELQNVLATMQDAETGQRGLHHHRPERLSGAVSKCGR